MTMRGSSVAFSAPEAAGMSRSISMTEKATALGLTMVVYPKPRSCELAPQCKAQSADAPASPIAFSGLSWLSLNSPSITGTATFSMMV